MPEKMANRKFQGQDMVPILTGGRYYVERTSLFIDNAKSSDTGMFILLGRNFMSLCASEFAKIQFSSNDSCINST